MAIQSKAKAKAKMNLVAIVDDDDLMRGALQGMLKSVGLPSQTFASAEEFLTSGQQHQTACLIADIRMPGMSGLELQAKLIADFESIGRAPSLAPGGGEANIVKVSWDDQGQGRRAGAAKCWQTCIRIFPSASKIAASCGAWRPMAVAAKCSSKSTGSTRVAWC